MKNTRRTFLKSSMGLITWTLAGPVLRYSSGTDVVFAKPASSATKRVLVVVHLDGGNDGLNTLVPYTDPLYYAARPTLAVPSDKVLKIDSKIGFNPVMTNFKSLFDQGLLAVVPNAGYPNPDLSHFRSRFIYMRADPNTQENLEEAGWLGKYGDLVLDANNSLSEVNFGVVLSPTLVGNKMLASSIVDFNFYRFFTDPTYSRDGNNQMEIFKRLNMMSSGNTTLSYIESAALNSINSSDSLLNSLSSYTSTISYPEDSLGKQLRMAAQLIAANVGVQVIYLTASGFDTHSNQKADQEKQLTSVSNGLKAFYDDLVQLNQADNILLMTFSEFGRRVKENGSQGTDHGTATPMFILGKSVKGGLYGNSPSLTDLDANGNIKFETDFRAVYSTIISDWLQADAMAVLGGKFENLGFLTSSAH